jgi:hypothetical protein
VVRMPNVKFQRAKTPKLVATYWIAQTETSSKKGKPNGMHQYKILPSLARFPTLYSLRIICPRFCPGTQNPIVSNSLLLTVTKQKLNLITIEALTGITSTTAISKLKWLI